MRARARVKFRVRLSRTVPVHDNAAATPATAAVAMPVTSQPTSSKPDIGTATRLWSALAAPAVANFASTFSATAKAVSIWVRVEVGDGG